MKEVRVSYLYEDRIASSVVECRGPASVAALVGAVLAPRLGVGRSIDATALVVFDMATWERIPAEAVHIGRTNHLGFYPEDQRLVPGATPRDMARTMRAVLRMMRA